MSFTTAIVIVPDTTLADLGVADPSPLTFEAASSWRADGLSAAQAGSHVVGFDPAFGVLAAQVLGERPYYVVALSGVSDTYALQASGPASRLLVHQDGEITEDRGRPLPAEQALAGAADLEDGHLAVTAALLGGSVFDLFDTEFVTLATLSDLDVDRVADA